MGDIIADMFMSWKKVAAVLAVVAIASGFLWWWQTEGQYKDIQFVSGDPDVSSAKEYGRYYEALKRAYAEDQYGGTTPEETLQLFIDALKAGDVELASKYFVVEKQGEIKKELEVGRQNNNLGFLIGDLEKEKKGIQISDAEYRFRTFDENNVAEFSFDLVLNTETSKWKILEL